VRVLVRVLEVFVVGMRVRMVLSVVTVFVFVLDVVMVVQDVRVCMRQVPVRVLLTVSAAVIYLLHSRLYQFETTQPRI
jgi:hypothetical protein